MPSLCEFKKENGTKCKRSPGHHTIQGRCLPFMKEKSTCSACVPDLWKDEIVVQDGSTLVSVINTKHVDGINDLSGHQDVLVRINALLKGNDIEEKVVADALLDLLQTPEWQFDPKKPKSFPYVLYFRRKLSLSLENTVAALVMMKKCHQDHKDKLKARQKDRRSSGDNFEICNGCLGTGSCHTATWTKLRGISFKCETCTNELLKQLSETNPSLYYVSEIGGGIFLYQNPLYDPTSIHSFCRVETFIYDLNLGTTRRLLPVVFMLLVAGVMVPSITDSVEAKENFSTMVNQMEKEHEEHKRKYRQRHAEKTDTLVKEQARILAKVGEDTLSLTDQEIGQAVERFGQVLDGSLTQASPFDPFIVMCNASSQELKMTSEGGIEGEFVDREIYRKLEHKGAAIFLTPSGNTLSEDEHFEAYSNADKFDRASTNGTYPMPVLVHIIVDAVNHEIVRKAEEEGIKLIQEKAKNTPDFISSEDTVYHIGQISEKWAGGATTTITIKGWAPLVQRGKISVNANLPRFMKENLMRIMPELKDLRHWRLVGDRLNLAERMRKMNALRSIANVNTSQPEQLSAAIIVAQPTIRQQARKQSHKRLQDRDVNALPKDDEDTDNGNKKQKAIPQRFFGKKLVVVSGNVGDRATLEAKLNASRLGLQMRANFPSSIGDRAGEYIFVSGEGAREKKVKTAKEHGVDTWTPGYLTESLAML